MITADILLYEYLDYEERRGTGPDTLYRRRYWLERYILFIDDDMFAITNKTVMAFLAGFSLSPEGYNRCLACIDSFYSYLVDREFADRNPARNIERIKIRRKSGYPAYTEREIELLITAADTPLKRKSLPVMKRDKAILELFYSSALRLNELISLDAGDIDYKSGEVFVRKGKGNRERIVPVGREALKAIENYSLLRKRLIKPGREYDALFLSREGNRMSKSAVMRMILRRKNEGEIITKGTSHILRRSCASHMLANGAGIEDIKRMLGHESIDTTERYISVGLSDLKRIHRRSHPRP